MWCNLFHGDPSICERTWDFGSSVLGLLRKAVGGESLPARFELLGPGDPTYRIFYRRAGDSELIVVVGHNRLLKEGPDKDSVLGTVFRRAGDGPWTLEHIQCKEPKDPGRNLDVEAVYHELRLGDDERPLHS